MKKIGRNRNTNDTPNKSTVVVNSSTSVLLFAANDERVEVIVSNPNNQGLFVIFDDEDPNTLSRDYYIAPHTTEKIISGDNHLTCSLSVIMALGGTKTVFGIES